MTRQELHPRDRHGCFTRGPIRPYPSLVGKTFGHLKVLRFAGIEPRADGLARIWKVRCRCGNIRFRNTNTLTSGRSRSCGQKCIYNVRRAIALGHAHRKHGHCLVTNYVRHNSPTWISWKGMHNRCHDLKRKGYGAASVQVCKRWSGVHGFERFLQDLGKRPKGKTLDRYPNPHGNYKPSNARWASASQQNRNKSESLRDIAMRAWATKRAKLGRRT
jgi:hypothetical protein